MGSSVWSKFVAVLCLWSGRTGERSADVIRETFRKALECTFQQRP
jgi:hypothetical protein